MSPRSQVLRGCPHVHNPEVRFPSTTLSASSFDQLANHRVSLHDSVKLCLSAVFQPLVPCASYPRKPILRRLNVALFAIYSKVAKQSEQSVRGCLASGTLSCPRSQRPANWVKPKLFLLRFDCRFRILTIANSLTASAKCWRCHVNHTGTRPSGSGTPPRRDQRAFVCVFADKQRFESSIRLCNSSCSSFHICIETTSSLYIVYSLHPPCLYHEPNFLHHLHQTAYVKSLKFAIDASRLNHLSSRYLPKRSLVQSSSTQLYCDT